MLACWHAELSLLCPFSYLASRTPCLSCLLQPPCFVLLSPLWPHLSASTSKHRCVPSSVLGFHPPAQSHSGPHLEISAPLPISLPWIQILVQTPRPNWIPGSQMLIVSHEHLQVISKLYTSKSELLIFPPKTCSSNQPQFMAIPSVQLLREITLQSSLTPLFLSHFQFTIKSCWLKTHTKSVITMAQATLIPWPRASQWSPNGSPFSVQEPGWFF